MDKEKQWIKKVQKNGNSEAANMLISKYYQEIYSFVYKQSLDSELSLDLTQEIFIRVLKSIHHYNAAKASFRTWLYRIASNRLIDYYRSKSYKYRQLSEPINDHDFEMEEDMMLSLEYKEDVQNILRLLNQLEMSSQQIVRLKLFAEYTLKEIAEIVQVPLSTVKSRYYTALKLIKKEMKEDRDE
ncbi:sigma-70 family RNA polymerase sigma factor [Bacillus sp. FJAT-42376]|uniref:RNA polymerase sigma factor n=1 Tax=Bacillus sp. FJAT-42376 TaxID=2014076 RepID=UPI000F4E2120|nr:sigma-70 family RNA polymerase sigma factor [Bacillus sp. FJAT-42376]AZB41414.1 sigma-70 family RNA polymerase sigma factor [Bacillus sp. FJAT-42376]